MPSTDTNKHQEKIRKIAKKAARETVEKIIKDESPDLNSDLSFDNDDSEPLTFSNLEPVDNEDIFDFAKRKNSDGDFMKLYIKRDDEYVTTKAAGFTVEQLQKEYGPGNYHIFCKRPNGQIAKQKVVRVATAFDPSLFGVSDLLIEKPEQPAVISDTDNFLKMATFMKTLNGDTEAKIREAAERAREDERRAADKAEREASRGSRDQSTVVTSMMTLIQESNKQSQNMFMEMSKNNMQMLREITESNNKMFERLNSKIESAGNKKDGIDTITLFKMLSDAEDKGYERRKDIDELAEERALARADELSDKEDKPDSMVGSLVKAVIPIITQVAKQQQEQAANPPGPTPAQITAHNQQVEEQRRLAFQREQVAKQQRINADIQARQRSAGGAGQGKAATSPQGAGPQGQQVQRDVGPVVQKATEVKRDSLGLPVADHLPVNGPAQTVSQKLNGHFKEHVSTLVFPVIGDSLLNGKDPQWAANQCLDLLKKQGITQKEVIDNFSYDDIIGLAASSGVPEEANPWLKEFHVAIQNTTRVESSGVSRPNS